MSDDNTQNQGQQGGGSSTVFTDVAIDKGKSAEQYIVEVENKYIVPPLVREKFTDLIKLIYETESMNVEEREYWLQIMPIMTEDQILKFREILVNERDQLAALDTEYEKEMDTINQKQNSELNEVEMKEKLHSIQKQEASSEEAEKLAEAELLKQLGSL